MTYMLLNTSQSLCQLRIVTKDGTIFVHDWEAGRSLAKELLKHVVESLSEHHESLQSLAGIGVMSGPGSFTGLRIGLTVVNTLASDMSVPIVGVQGEDDWASRALERLQKNENDIFVMPEYGADAHITSPRG